MWQYCHPCLESIEPTSIIEIEHINEDKDVVFATVGLQYGFTWSKAPSENHEFADDYKTQKK